MLIQSNIFWSLYSSRYGLYKLYSWWSVKSPTVWLFSPEAVAQRCFVNKVFLKISQNSQENTCARVSFLIKMQSWGLQLYSKRDSGTGTCEFCKISKNTCSYRTPPKAASISPTFRIKSFLKIFRLKCRLIHETLKLR